MEDIKIRKLIDKRLNLNEDTIFEIKEGGRNVNIQHKVANSQVRAGIDFNDLNPGSVGFCIPRQIFVDTIVQFHLEPKEILGKRASAVVDSVAKCRTFASHIVSALNSRTHGFRALPLHKSMTNLEVFINGQTYSEQIGSYIDPLLHYDNMPQKHLDMYSGTPIMQDTMANYQHLDASYPNPAKGSPLIPFNHNPLQDYGSTGNSLPRGAFGLPFAYDITDVLADTLLNGTPQILRNRGIAYEFVAGSAANSIELVSIRRDVGGVSSPFIQQIVEPLLIPLLKYDNMDSKALYGISELNIRCVFSSNIDNTMFGGITPQTSNTGITKPGYIVEGFQDSKILYDIIDPKMAPELPSSNIYSDNRIKLRSDNLSDTLKQTIDNVQVGYIPEKVFIFACKDHEQKTQDDCDAFLSIKKFNFTWNNQGTQFSSAEPFQLYMMCKRNGLNMPDYETWKNRVGSVLCIDFSRDVSLQTGLYPGATGSFTYRYDIEFEKQPGFDSVNNNYSTQFGYQSGQPGTQVATTNLKLYTISVLPGFSVIQNHQSDRNAGMPQVDPTQVPLMDVYGDRDGTMYGGGLKETVSKYAKKAIDLGKKIQPYAEKAYDFGKKAAPYVGKAVEYAALLAAGNEGLTPAQAQKLIEDYGLEEATKMAKKISKSKRGGGLVGGKKAGKSVMRKQLSLY